jgi:hypothetical protein
MPAYETEGFSPPAPVVRSLVRGPEGQVYQDVPLLLDSGVDVTVLPLHVANAVGAVALPSEVPILLFNAREYRLMQAELQVEFLRFRFRGHFLLGELEYGVVGRNILNLLVLTLDGPRQTWSA